VEATASIKAIADRDRLQQVLINLIDNAVKYSDAAQPIILSIDRFDGQAIIRVRDRGVGIPLQDQSRIFERFYRVDEARTRLPQAGIQVASDGHGLGLAIVKTLVEGMGGSISVRSKLGEGTEFSIALPT
jgi:signal transduction histidine kinase